MVVAAASLYFYMAPSTEATVAGRALTRVLHSPREIQYIVLSNIATMAAVRPVRCSVPTWHGFLRSADLLPRDSLWHTQTMFEPFLLDFFVNSTDAAFIRKLKLGILTCIASETNISTILEELNVRCLHSSVPSVSLTCFPTDLCAQRR